MHSTPHSSCYKYQRFGFVAAECRRKRRCGKCGGNHNVTQCQAEEICAVTVVETICLPPESVRGGGDVKCRCLEESEGIMGTYQVNGN